MEGKTGIVPLALVNKPDLPDDLVLQLNLFSAVAKDRQYTMAGPMPLGSTAILAYCQLYDLPRVTWSYLADVITDIDSWWLEWQDKNKPTAPTPAPPPSNPRAVSR